MKSHLLTLVLFLALLPMAKAQESMVWCPPGATWHLEGYTDWGEPGCYKLFYNGDELINDILCKRIARENCHPSKDNNAIEAYLYTYENEGVVYVYDELENSFDTLYNFNAKIDDQWNLSYWGLNIKVTVTDVSIEIINDFSLRQLKLLYWGDVMEKELEATVCERIGNIRGHLFSMIGVCGWDFEEDVSVLRCYQDDEFPLYDRQIVPYCDYEYSSIEETESHSQLSIFPNPVQNESIQISFVNPISGQVEIEISDLLGKIVHKTVLGQNGGTISVADLPAGVYLLSAKNEKNIFKTEKLIVR